MLTHPSTRTNRSPNALLSDTGGAVYVEFLLAFIPLFFLFLGMVQMGLMYGADLAVRHAAVNAARAAMVVIDDDPQGYDGEGRRSFESDGNRRDTVVRRVIEAMIGGGSSPVSRPPSIDSQRFSDIHSAASVPLLPFAPFIDVRNLSDMGNENVLRAIGTVPEGRAAFGLVYNESALNVTFPREPVSREFRTSWDAPDDDGVSTAVTARVTYLFHCAVPLVNRLMCEDLFALMYGADAGAIAAVIGSFSRGEMSFSELQAALESIRYHSDRRDRWAPRTEELQGGSLDYLAAIAGLMSAFGGPSLRFAPIQREATMPLQAANYCYRSEGSGSGCWEQETAM